MSGNNDPDPAHASQVEIRFNAEGPRQTRVELAHSGFEAHGAGAEAVRGSIGGEMGWTFVLALYAAAV